MEKDFTGAMRFALRPQRDYLALDGMSQMIATLEVYIASDQRINGE